MYKKCYKCFYSVKTCNCKEIVPIETNIKFVILIHPKEAFKQKTGTGRLTHLFLKDSELITGVNYTNNKRVIGLLNNKTYFPVILYPSKNPLYVEEEQLAEKLGNKKLLIFILDGTWREARRMLWHSKNLIDLPCISFKSTHVSEYKFKKQPKNYCLSTIESVYYLLQGLKKKNIVKDYSDSNSNNNSYNNMLNYFKSMVKKQSSFTNGKDKNSVYR